jgi:hypothetical protein
MSSASLLQLVAQGQQDQFITGSPQVTFFRGVYRRHTNFAMESMEQTLTGNADFGRKCTATVSRSGDLIHKAYLQVDLPALTPGGAAGANTIAWTRNVGHHLIEEVSVDIGGAIIDRQYGQWLDIWAELTMPAAKADGYDVMIGNTATLTTQASSVPASTLYIPLQFWFCRNAGLALPLIALQHHDVRINVTFRPFAELYVTQATGGGAPTAQPAAASLRDVKLFVDYIYLDGAERRMFTSSPHEYLIEQVQAPGASSFTGTSVREKLSLSHPTKFLAWVFQADSAVASGANRWSDYTTPGGTPYAGNEPMVEGKIQLGSHDRISTRPAGYFNLVQPHTHFTRSPSTGVYVFSFALKPEEHQPSGSINMSRIESVVISATTSSAMSGAYRLHVYAVNYNVLRITSGLGGLAFAS